MRVRVCVCVPVMVDGSVDVDELLTRIRSAFGDNDNGGQFSRGRFGVSKTHAAFSDIFYERSDILISDGAKK